MTQQQRATISTLFDTKLAAQSIKEKLENAHGIKEDYMAEMFDIHLKVTAQPGELIYCTIPEFEQSFNQYKVWSKYIQADSTALGQFVAANNTILAHELKMIKLYEDKSIESTEIMNKEQLKSWREKLDKACEKARFENARKGLEGLYQWTVHGPSLDL